MLVLSHSESDLYSVIFLNSRCFEEVLKNFESLCQLAEPVGKPDQPVH